VGSQYCDPSDLTLYAINPLALQGIPNATQVAACVAASERADSYLRGRFPLPLLAWGQDVRMHTAYIAVFLLLSARGYNPSAGADDLIRERYYEAVGYPDRPGSGWFPGVQRQAIHPDVTFSQPNPPNFSLPSVRTGGPSGAPIRGWTTVRNRSRGFFG
jgi:phage gp36-like protein